MSLVGTRPILPDELEQYELHHRTSADLDGEEKIRRKDIEKVLTCRDLDKSMISCFV